MISSPFFKRHGPVALYVVASILVVAGIIYFFGIRPTRELSAARPLLLTKEFLELQNNIRTGLAQAIGGTAILIGLFFTWRNIRITEQNLLIGQKNLKVTQRAAHRNLVVAQEGQITERFTQAIEHLGSNKLEVRLGGIYALARIANDSEKDHWQIMEVLTAYVREHSRWTEKKATRPAPVDYRTDLQAILTVIGRRTRRGSENKDQELDFGFTDLRSASLREGHFERANFVGAHLEGANLDHAHLEKAYFGGASLDGAEMEWAHLEGANFGDANLNANLMDAHLEGADLRFVAGLTQEHLDLSILDARTKLPPGIVRTEDHKKQKQ